MTSYEYVLSLKDQMSGNLQKITGTSKEAIDKFKTLNDKTQALMATTGDFGRSIYNLKQKIDLLQQERDLIDPQNLQKIRQYNSEIKKLTKEVTHLETINGSRFKTWTKDAFGQLPGLATNPIVLAGTAMFSAGRAALAWDEGMAKINTTAQLSKNELKNLGSTIKKMGLEAGADLNLVPNAYEKILSQTGEVAVSTDILGSALKGAKAGFTDIDTVSGALVQTISLVGKENTNAAEVMDVLFGAKRVGAGEFGDFARYIPGLIAGGKAIGVGFKDTAGLFAYMTGKGMSAERSATLLENAYTAFGKSDITSGLETEGISVFNLDGSMKQMDVIFAQLQNKLAGFGSNDEAKSGFLEKIGLKDTQAKQAFMVLASDSAKLKESMDTTRNATWELNKALEFARNPSDNLKENWAKIQLMLIDGGRAVTEILSPALEILSPVLSGVAWLTGKISDYFSTWVQAIKDGNPFILGLTGSIAAYTIMLNQATIAKKLTSFWDGILSLKTKLLTGETWALNTALLANPFVWIPVAIGAVVAAIIYAWKHFEGFRKVIMGVWEVMKQFGKVLYEAVIGRLIDLVKGIGQVGIALWKLMKGDFKGAWESTKEGFANMSGINSAGRALEEGKKLGAAWEKGKQLGAESWAKSQEQKTESDTVPGSSGFLGAGAVGGKGGVLGPDNAPVGPTGGEASSGGTKNITITIGKVGVDSVTLAVQNVREGVGEIREMLQSELIRVVNSIALS